MENPAAVTRPENVPVVVISEPRVVAPLKLAFDAEREAAVTAPNVAVDVETDPARRAPDRFADAPLKLSAVSAAVNCPEYALKY